MDDLLWKGVSTLTHDSRVLRNPKAGGVNFSLDAKVKDDVSCVYSGKDKVVWCVLSSDERSVELMVLEDGGRPKKQKRKKSKKKKNTKKK